MRRIFKTLFTPAGSGDKWTKTRIFYSKNKSRVVSEDAGHNEARLLFFIFN